MAGMFGRSRVVFGVVGAIAATVLLAAAGAAPASAEPAFDEARVLGQVERDGYREVGIAVKLTEEVDLGTDTIPASAINATLLPSTNRPVGWIYTSDEMFVRPDRTNVPGEWLIIEFTSHFSPSPPSAAGLAGRQYSVAQVQPISGNGMTIPPSTIPTIGVASPVLDEFQPASTPVAGEDPMLYRYFVPREVRDESGWEGVKYPLVLALHGSGERGDANGHDNLRQMTANQLGVAWAWPNRQATNPAFVIVPQARTMTGNPTAHPTSWGVPARKDALVSLINEFIADYPVDTRRIYVTGASMGGMGTWDLYSSNPSLFAAAMPMASGIQTVRGMTTDLIPPLVNKPLWNLHAADDGVVTNNGSILARNTLIDLGATVNHAEFAGNLPLADANAAAAAQIAAANLAGSNQLFTTYLAGTVSPSTHESWKPTLPNDTIINWLFSQTIDGGPVILPPDAPAAPVAEPGDGEVSLTWEAPASEGGAPISNYTVNVYTDIEGEPVNTISAGLELETLVTGLTNDVEYSFTVHAENAGGPGEPSPAVTATPFAPPPPVVVDRTPPNTRITKKPGKSALKLKKKGKKSKRVTVKFRFASTEAGSTFQCRLNTGSHKKWKGCKPGKKYKLKAGKYKFQVRARDRAGNVDRSPAVRRFKVVKPRR